MRIAFISLMNDAPWGGSEVLWVKTAALALAQGHQVLVTSYQKSMLPLPMQELVQAGATLFYRAAYSPKLHIRLLRRLKQQFQPASTELLKLKEYQPDVIFINQGGHNDIIYKPDIQNWLLSGAVPYVIICHLYRDPYRQSEVERTATLAIFKQAREVYTISAKQTEVLRRQLADPLPNARVVQNPLNLPVQMPMPYPAAGQVQLAIVASLDADRKGHDVLLQALSTPTWKARDWQLNVYGKGPDLAYLQRLAEYYSLGDRVQFRGYVAESGEIWRSNHLLLIASRIESGPMVLVEAMLSGRPVVSTDVGIVPDWLTEGETGFLAEAALPESLGAALERAWQVRAEWSAIGLRAYEHARAQMQADPAAEMLQRLEAAARQPPR